MNIAINSSQYIDRRKGLFFNFAERKTTMKTNIDKLFEEMIRHSVGVDRTFDLHRDLMHRSSNNNNFPPYNIKKIDDVKYEIELALAGYSQEDIEITVEKNTLSIISKGQNISDENFLYKGFTHKGFERVFTIADNVKVVDAGMRDGVLSVYLERFIPEEDKPKKLSIRNMLPAQKQLA